MYPKHFDRDVQHELMDEFYFLDTAKWASVDDGATGTNTANDVAGGEVSILSAASDNDYHVMASTKKAFKFAADKPLWFEARFSLTEANTNAANWIMGLCSITTTGVLAADGGGVPSTFDGALFYKVDGTMSIKFASSAATVQNKDNVIATFTSGVVYRVGFHFDPGDGTNGRIYPWVYNETTKVLVNSNKSSQDLATPIALSGLGAMYLLYGVKAGSASAETLKIDYIRCVQAR